METKNITIKIAIALVVITMLAVPVSALWNNGNWVAEDHNQNCDAVKFDPKTGVMSCYRDNNPIKQINASNEGSGGVAVGSVRAGYSTLSQTIAVRNILQDKNVSSMNIDVLPDATFRIPVEGVLAPGEYEATLDNFDLPDETVRFTIAANQQGPTRIVFLGQAVSGTETMESSPEPVCKVKIISVLYGCGGYCGKCDEPGTQVESRSFHKNRCIWATDNVREAVSAGYTTFLFNNAENPGGIFDVTTTNLLSQIVDPSPGDVKNVRIIYNGCDGKKHSVVTDEYQTIDLI